MVSILSLLHGWAYWCILTADVFNFSLLAELFPFFLIILSVSFTGIASTVAGEILFQNKFNLNPKTDLILCGLIYAAWCFSALMLYYPNRNADAYSASLGIIIYVPLHIGFFTVTIFLLSLIVAQAWREPKITT